MECSVYGNYHRCVTPETRMNDEVKDVLEEDSGLNTRLIQAWQNDKNGVCSKIKKVTTLPDCTTNEQWLSDWTGTLIYSNQIPSQYKQDQEVLAPLSSCPACPICEPEIVEKEVNVTVTEYVEKIDYTRTIIFSGAGVLVSGLITIMIIVGLLKGHKSKFEACPKCGGYNIRKYFGRNMYYCQDCFRRTHFRKTQQRNIKEEAKKDMLKMVNRVK